MTVKQMAVFMCVAGFFSCRPKDCFDSKTEEKPTLVLLEDFTELEVSQNFDIVLVNDVSSQSYMMTEATGGPYSTISTEISNGKLKITDNKTCDWSRNLNNRLKIFVNVKRLTRIDLHGDASLSCRDTLRSSSDTDVVINYYSNNISDLVFKGRRLTVNHRSLGEFRLHGKCEIFVPVIYDAGKVTSAEMESDFAFVYHYGINDCTITPVHQLEANIYNRGNIYYTRAPQSAVVFKGNGTGKAIQR